MKDWKLPFDVIKISPLLQSGEFFAIFSKRSVLFSLIFSMVNEVSF